MKKTILSNPWIYHSFIHLVTRGRKVIKEILSREVTVSGKERILDLACGTGDFSSLFGVGSYVGVDLHEGYLRFARRNFGRTFAVMDSRCMGFKDDVFDGSICVGLFHHLAGQEARLALEELRRTLKSGGWGVIVELIHPISKYNLLGKLVEKLDQGNFTRYPEQYCSLFSEYFSVEKMYQRQSWPWDVGVFRLRCQKPLK